MCIYSYKWVKCVRDTPKQLAGFWNKNKQIPDFIDCKNKYFKPNFKKYPYHVLL